MFKKGIAFAVVALVGLGIFSKEARAFGFFSKKSKTAKVVQLKGSDTILNLSQAIAEEFMKENKKTRIAVTGGGSGVGVAGKLNGTADIAMASRSIKSKELSKAKSSGLKLEEVVLAYDGITVITNKSNPVKNLDSKTLGKIFAGKITNWNQVGGPNAQIIVLSRDSSSGTHIFFKEHILRGGDKKSTVEYGPKTLYMPSNQAIKQEVAKSQYAIGYIGMGYMDNSVNSLSVNSIEPSFKNVADKSYPIARAVYWYVDADRNGIEADLVKFAQSATAKEIVKKEGFVPTM